MKKLITIFNIEDIKNLHDKVDGFIFGNNNYGTRLASNFSIADIVVLLKEINLYQKEAFILANKMLFDSDLKPFQVFLESLPMHLVTGIIVGDIGAFNLLKKMGHQEKVIYNPETLLTNIYDFNMLSAENIYGAYVSKEITLADTIQIAKNKKIKMFLVGHGHLNMFYSKRKLLHNYETFYELDNDFQDNYKLTIKEETRLENYPILEDNSGTHVFRSYVKNSLNEIEELEKYIDYFVYDTIFKDSKYNEMILDVYNNKIDKKVIQEKYNEKWDSGFYYTKTIYKQGIEND